MGREDHTRNTLCARWLLQDVRLDENGKGKRVGWGCEEDTMYIAALKQSQEYFCSVLGHQMISSLLSRVQLNQQAPPNPPTQHYRGENKGELPSHFSVGMTKPTNS